MKNIEEQLSHLRLNGMHSGWKAMVETRRHHKLSLSEGLEILLQDEQENRTYRRFERLQKAAKFRYQASIEELSPDASRGLDPNLITQLSKGTYLEKGESILITGATGCGKSFLASALGHQACQVKRFNLCHFLRFDLCHSAFELIKLRFDLCHFERSSKLVFF